MCLECNAPIRGQSKYAASGNYTPPLFCHACGKAYPWMKDRLNTARELLYHDDQLTLDQREELWDLLQYVMSDPKADLVPAKMKLIEIKLKPAMKATREALLDLAAKIAVESLKS